MLPSWVKPGVSFRHGITGYIFHIRGMVDGRAVVRYWSNTKQRWNYEVYHDTFFVVNADCLEVREKRSRRRKAPRSLSRKID
jgi:hypothetical protein